MDDLTEIGTKREVRRRLENLINNSKRKQTTFR